ncbi:MAG: hypothetical protein QMD08_08135 [Actinomycetota bacterium]|nr:hypothetical protein [Actinomycetota bacterium]
MARDLKALAKKARVTQDVEVAVNYAQKKSHLMYKENEKVGSIEILMEEFLDVFCTRRGDLKKPLFVCENKEGVKALQYEEGALIFAKGVPRYLSVSPDVARAMGLDQSSLILMEEDEAVEMLRYGEEEAQQRASKTLTSSEAIKEMGKEVERGAKLLGGEKAKMPWGLTLSLLKAAMKSVQKNLSETKTSPQGDKAQVFFNDIKMEDLEKALRKESSSFKGFASAEITRLMVEEGLVYEAAKERVGESAKRMIGEVKEAAEIFSRELSGGLPRLAEEEAERILFEMDAKDIIKATAKGECGISYIISCFVCGAFCATKQAWTKRNIHQLVREAFGFIIFLATQMPYPTVPRQLLLYGHNAFLNGYLYVKIASKREEPKEGK